MDYCRYIMLPTKISKKTINLALKLIPMLMLSYSLLSVASQPSAEKLESSKRSPAITANFQSFYYLGGKMGNNRYQDGCESWSIHCKENDFAMGIFAGYQFNKYFAFETAYLNLGQAEATYLETGVEQIYKGSMQGLELSALATIDLTEKLSTFAKVGTFNWFGENSHSEKSSKDNSWVPTAGLGMAYQISHAWQARLEYQYFHALGNDTLGSSSSHLTTLGISYRFGDKRKAPLKQVIPAKKNIAPTAKPVPVVLPEKILPAQTVKLLFAFDDSKLLTPQALSAVIDQLRQYPQTKVILKGYTDTRGSSAYNLLLAKKRVVSVKEYLLSQGIKTEQISRYYFGEQAPLFDNLTVAHRAQNRRVLVILPTITLNESVKSKQGSAQ
ncbi:MAG: outer membrane beta-barrel protein [Colwellia sp.]